MDTRDTKRVTLTLTLPVTVTVDVAAGPNGPEVVSVRDVAMPEAEEVMGALDHEGRFDELDALYQKA